MPLKKNLRAPKKKTKRRKSPKKITKRHKSPKKTTKRRRKSPRKTNKRVKVIQDTFTMSQLKQINAAGGGQSKAGDTKSSLARRIATSPKTWGIAAALLVAYMRFKRLPLPLKNCPSRDFLCGFDIKTRKDYTRWSFKGGHPDKGGDSKTFARVVNCVTEGHCCKNPGCKT